MTMTIVPNFETYVRTAALAVLLISAPSVVTAAEEPKPGTISVSATGTQTIVPDNALIQLSVLRQEKTARAALDANTQAMTEVLQAMKDAGIADKDLQTSNFNIQPVYHYPKRSNSGGQKPPKIIGYTVTNSLSVRIRDLNKVGSILDQSVTLGMNSGGHVSFISSDPEPAIQAARKKAMEKAIDKANTLTSAAGVNLGRILQISENAGRRPRPVAMARTAKLEMASDASVPIAAGENSYSVTVSVSWEIVQ